MKPLHVVISAVALGAGLSLSLAAMATAADTSAPTPSARVNATPAARDVGHRRGAMARRGALARVIAQDPAMATVINLRALERATRRDGKPDEVLAIYRDVLTRTQDPLVRNFAHYRIARLEMRDDDARAALAALRANLDENLARLRQ